MSIIKAAVVQQQNSADINANKQHSAQQIKLLAEQGVQLLLLQELHCGLYFCQQQDVKHFDLAQPLDGEHVQFFANLAKEYNLVLVISIFEKRAAGLYHNTAVVLDADRGMVGHYRKMHIPDDPGFNEKFYFTPGEHQHEQQAAFRPIQTQLGKLGVLVCWDQWYPEAARLMALNGADILLYPTAIGWDRHDCKDEQQRQLNAWRLIQQSHGVANGLPVMVANRIGFEADPKARQIDDGIEFWGNSFIAGPQGEILVEANAYDVCTLITEINLAHSEQVRRIWPFFRDRRIDAYQDLSKRWRD